MALQACSQWTHSGVLAPSFSLLPNEILPFCNSALLLRGLLSRVQCCKQDVSSVAPLNAANEFIQFAKHEITRPRFDLGLVYSDENSRCRSPFIPPRRADLIGRFSFGISKILNMGFCLFSSLKRLPRSRIVMIQPKKPVYLRNCAISETLKLGKY